MLGASVYEPTIDGHAIGLRLDTRALGRYRHTIDLDMSGSDQLFGVAARGDASMGKKAGQTLTLQALWLAVSVG